jgi:hypothetical protein
MSNQAIRLLLLLSFFGATLSAQTVQQRAFTTSQGGAYSTGAIRHEVVVGQTAANTGSLSLTGLSGHVGFLTIDKPINTAPSADAGDDDLVPEGTNVQLDGTLSFDPQGDGLTYIWESLDGVNLISSSGPTPSFLAPDVLARRKYRFLLSVSDGTFTSPVDTVTISVSDPEWIPIAYSNSSTTYAVVTLNNQVAEKCDYVGAFINGECRAAAEVILFQGQAFAVFNIQTELPETVNFRVYDYSEDRICDAPNTVTSIPGGDLGSFSNPIPINAECSAFFAAFTVSNLAVCAGETVTVNFTGGAEPTSQFNWNFPGATVLSGSGQGPYILRWNSAGASVLELQIVQSGVSSNTFTKQITVYSSNSTTVTQFTCVPQDTSTNTAVFSNVFGCDSTIVTKTVYVPTIFTLIGADNYCNDPFIRADVASGPGNYTYQWSTGDNTPVVFGIADGTYMVTITDVAGCNYTGSIQVGGTPPLASSVNMIQGAGCATANGRATVLPTGGIPPYTFQWDNGETGAAAIALTAGPHTVTVEDAAGCQVEAQVIVIPLGFPIVSGANTQDYFCGSPGSINVTIISGTPPFSYLWSSGQTSEDISGLLPGFYSLTATDQNGCIATISNLEVANLGDEVELSFSQQNCALSATALNGTSPYTYTWSNNVTGNSTSPVVTDSMYIVSVTDAAGCFGTDTVVAQTGIVSAAFDYDINGFEVLFISDSAALSSFWNFGDGNTSAGANPTHTYSANGTYTVVHITTTPCGVDSFSTQVMINVVNTSTPLQTQIVKVFPNPTTGQFTVDMAFSKPVNGQCMLFDILGRLVIAREVVGTEANVSLDITNQSDGIYWLSLQTDSGFSVHKIIKQSK